MLGHAPLSTTPLSALPAANVIASAVGYYYRYLLGGNMNKIFYVSEGTAARRRAPVQLVDATDGITAENGENGGQPQLSFNGSAYSNTTATLVFLANGSYYLEFTLSELQTAFSQGGDIRLRYKSANTAEFNQSWPVVNYNPYDPVRAGLTALPNANAEAAGGLFTRGTGAGQINQQANGQVDVNIERVRNSVIAALTSSGFLQVTLLRWLTDNAAGTPAALTTNGYLQSMLLRWLTDNAGGTPSALVSNKVPADPVAIDTQLSATHGAGNWEGGGAAPTVNQIRDGILNALLTGFAIQGSVGDAIALTAGLLQGNFIMDTVTHDANGQTSARLRVFRNATDTNAGTGEFATFTATTTYVGPNQVNVHKVVRV